MNSTPKPNVAISLFTIHKVITRGLTVSLENAQEFSRSGFPDEVTKEGYLNYLRALISILHGHHLVEDELAFPYFTDKLPGTPFELLTTQHQAMIPLIDEIQAIINRIDSGVDVPVKNNELVLVLKRLSEAWHAHIPIEEKHFDVGVIDEMLPVEEQLRLIKQYAQHSQEHTGPAFLTIPFILYNLPPDIRGIMAKGMPAELTEKLVPIVWKEHWESMGPFLLE
jgi:hemerythrin-like domain-containing protein